jgi:hypothetical protein
MGSQTWHSRTWIGDFSGRFGRYYRSVSTQIDKSLPQLAFQVPHGIQQAMSAESMPVLSSAIITFKVFMSTWEDLRKSSPHLAPWIDVGLKWAKKYYQFMDDTDAYIVTMGEFFIFIIST